jgi:hypothetical protein
VGYSSTTAALLLPSDHVIFKDDSHNPTQISVPAQTFSQRKSIEKPAVLRVKNVGLQVLIQDEGRKNLAELGVGRQVLWIKRHFVRQT